MTQHQDTKETTMLDEPTYDRLISMRLRALADAWQAQQKDPECNQLTFDERLGLLVDAEWTYRERKKVERNLKDAKLRDGQACIEDIDYSKTRGLSKATILELATCKWVELHHNIVITGMTGVGKTYVACALAQQACRRGYRVLYRRVSRLFHELALAHADGSYVQLLAKLAKADVLVLDDWGGADVGPRERRDLNEVMDDRYGLRSTVITSQLPTAKWHDHLGDPTTADAICDRILNNAHRMTLTGPSRRKTESNLPE
jgi:DNA replication protein DnaC